VAQPGGLTLRLRLVGTVFRVCSRLNVRPVAVLIAALSWNSVLCSRLLAASDICCLFQINK